MSSRQALFPSSTTYVDPTPLPDSVPTIPEVGATSGPLKSAAFFIGDKCKAFNDDFMLCKKENRDPEHCLKEGRRVTRCAQDVLTQLRANCETVWNAHWKCLENNNQEYNRCRKLEKSLNGCAFDKLKFDKQIPGLREGEVPIHLKENPIFKGIQK